MQAKAQKQFALGKLNGGNKAG